MKAWTWSIPATGTDGTVFAVFTFMGMQASFNTANFWPASNTHVTMYNALLSSVMCAIVIYV